MVKSLCISHHLTNRETPSELLLDEKEMPVFNPDHETLINNDGLFTTLLLSIMPLEVLSLIVVVDNAYSSWNSIEGQLLPSTKEYKHLLKDRLAYLNKGSLLLVDLCQIIRSSRLQNFIFPSFNQFLLPYAKSVDLRN